MPEIFQLTGKLTTILKDPWFRKRLGGERTDAGFCKALGINLETLNSWKKNGRISIDGADRLAARCGFSTEWPEWDDPKCLVPRDEVPSYYSAHPRPDSAALFADRWLIERIALLSSHVASPGTPPTSPESRMVAVPHDENTWQFDAFMGSVGFTVRQSPLNQPWPVGFWLNCNPAPVEGIEFALHRVRVQLNCGSAYAEHPSAIRRRLKGVTLSGADGSITVQVGGDEQLPQLELHARKSWLGDVGFPDDFYFANVFGLKPGDALTYRVSAHYLDMRPVDDDDPAAPPQSRDQQKTRGFSFSRTDGGELRSVAKRNLLLAFAKRGLIPSTRIDGDGQSGNLSTPDGAPSDLADGVPSSSEGWVLICKASRRFTTDAP